MPSWLWCLKMNEIRVSFRKKEKRLNYKPDRVVDNRTVGAAVVDMGLVKHRLPVLERQLRQLLCRLEVVAGYMVLVVEVLVAGVGMDPVVQIRIPDRDRHLVLEQMMESS